MIISVSTGETRPKVLATSHASRTYRVLQILCNEALTCVTGQVARGRDHEVGVHTAQGALAHSFLGLRLIGRLAPL